jgi:hypothetical protein
MPARHQLRMINSVALNLKKSFELSTIATIGQFRILIFPPSSLDVHFIKFLQNTLMPFKAVIDIWMIIYFIKNHWFLQPHQAYLMQYLHFQLPSSFQNLIPPCIFTGSYTSSFCTLLPFLSTSESEMSSSVFLKLSFDLIDFP